VSQRSIGRALTLYGLGCLLVIGLAGAALAVVWGTAPERQAVLVSALVALVVQMVAFAIARLLAASGNGVAGWALGAVICVVALVIFGFVGRALGLPSNAALVSLATFFFLTELIEPPLLNA
jgi:heme/copper-type cytochrome/quinol oxidase subunit 4